MTAETTRGICDVRSAVIDRRYSMSTKLPLRVYPRHQRENPLLRFLCGLR